MLNVLCFFSKYLHGQGVTDMEKDIGLPLKNRDLKTSSVPKVAWYAGVRVVGAIFRMK